jgi:hypothetical protein
VWLLAVKSLDGHGLNSIDHIIDESGLVVSKRYAKVAAVGKIQWIQYKTAADYFKVI